MAVYNDSDFNQGRQPAMISILAYRLVDMLDQGAIALHRHAARRRTERALSRLSPRQLQDIGIDRPDSVR